MAEKDALAATYGAEASNGGGFWDSVTDWASQEATEIKSTVDYAARSGYEAVSGLGQVVSDAFETKVFNELSDAGIEDYSKYEEFSKYSAAMSEEDRRVKEKELFDSGVISDAEKFKKYQADQAATRTQEQKTLDSQLADKRTSFITSAIEEMKKSGAIGNDSAAPEARRIIDGINEVAADYVTNYAKIIADDSGNVNKEEWLGKFKQYDADMQRFVKDWALAVKSGSGDQEAYDNISDKNPELMERVRGFDHDLGSASIGASTKKYWDRVTNPDSVTSFIKNGVGLGMSGISQAFYEGIGGVKKFTDVGVKDVEGLEELQHTDNAFIDEAWESAPEILSLALPLKALTQIERLGMITKGGRAARYLGALGGEMAGDVVLMDPYVQALQGRGFTDRDMAENFAMNLAFNSLIAFRAKGGDMAFQQSILDMDGPKADFGITKSEIDAINAGNIREAQVMMANRLMNGSTEDVIDITTFEKPLADKVRQVGNTITESLEKAKAGEADSATVSWLSSALVTGNKMDAEAAGKAVAMSDLAKTAEGYLEKGDPKALAAYNFMLIKKVADTGALSTDEIGSVLSKMDENVSVTEAEMKAKEQLKAQFAGLTYQKEAPELQKAVDARKMEYMQGIVDNALVRSGKMPEGYKLYGTYSKRADGTYVNVRTGEVYDAETAASLSSRFTSNPNRNRRNFKAQAVKNTTDTRYQTQLERTTPAEEIGAEVASMVENGMPAKLSVRQFDSLRVAMKGAIIADLEMQGKEINAKNFSKHPAMKAWKRNDDGTYSVDHEAFGFDVSLAPAIANRITKALRVFTPSEFVNEIANVVRTGEFVRNIDEEAEAVRKSVDELPVAEEVKASLNNTLDTATDAVRVLKERNDDLAEAVVKGKLSIDEATLTRDEMEMESLYASAGKTKRKTPASESGWDGKDNTGWRRVDKWKPTDGSAEVTGAKLKRFDDLNATEKELLSKINVPNEHLLHRHDATWTGTTKDGKVLKGIDSGMKNWNDRLEQIAEEASKGKLDAYILSPGIKNGKFVYEWNKIVHSEPGDLRKSSIHVPHLAVIKKGKLSYFNLWSPGEFTKTGAPFRTIHEKQSFKGNALFSRQVVKELGLKTSKDIRPSELIKANGGTVAFAKEIGEYWKKFGSDVKSLRILTKEEAEASGISGRYFPKSKRIELIDNDTLEVFFHEFGHHIEDQIPVHVRRKLNEWYDVLYKDKYENFQEFFAEFVSDAFIRKRNDFATAAKNAGLETDGTLIKLYGDAIAYFKAVVSKVMEVVVAVIKGAPQEELSKASTDAYFDILLRDMREGDYKTTDAYGWMLDTVVLGRLSGNDVSKADMLTRFLLTMGKSIGSKQMRDSIAKVPEEMRATYVGKVISAALRGSLRLKKRFDKDLGKSVYDHTRTWSGDKHMGSFADFLNAAKPVFDFIRKNEYELVSDPALGKKVADAFQSIVKTAGDGNSAQVMNRILEKLRGSDYGSAEELEGTLSFYLDYFLARGRFTRAAHMTAAKGNSHEVFRTQFVTGLHDKIKDAELAKKPVTEIVKKLKDVSNEMLDEVSALAIKEKIVLPSVVDDLLNRVLALSENAEDLARIIKSNSGKSLREINPVIDAFKEMVDAVRTRGNRNVTEALRDAVGRDFDEALPKPSVTDDATGEIREAVVIADDVTSGMLYRSGDGYFEVEGAKTVTAFAFDPAKLLDSEFLIVPKNVLVGAFVDGSGYLKRVRDFVLANPERVTLTSANVFADQGKAVINASDEGMFKFFEKTVHVPSDFSIPIDMLEREVTKRMPPGSVGLNFASRIKHGIYSSIIAASPERFFEFANAEAFKGTSLWTRLSNTKTQFDSLMAKHFKNKDATISARNAISSLSIAGKIGDVYRAILHVNPQWFKDRSFRVYDLAVPEEFVTLIGGQSGADVLTAQFVIRRILSALSDGSAEKLTSFKKSIAAQIQRSGIIEKEVGMNLDKDQDALRLFAKSMKREMPTILQNVSENAIIDALITRGDNGVRDVRNLLRNTYQTSVVSGFLDTSYQLSKADALEVSQAGRGVFVSYEGISADYAAGARKTLERFVDGLTEGTAKQVTTDDEGVELLEEIPVDDILETFGTGMKRYVEWMKDAVSLEREMPNVRGTVDTRLTLNAALFGNADWGSKVVSDAIKNAKSFKMTGQLDVTGDLLADFAKLFAGGDGVLNAAKKLGVEFKLEVPEETRAFFKENLKWTDADFKDVDFDKFMKHPVSAIKYLASIAYWTKHGNFKEADVAAARARGVGEFGLDHREVSYGLFDVVTTKDGKSFNLPYDTNNMHLNPFVNRFIADMAAGMRKGGSPKSIEAANDLEATAKKLGSFDTLTLIYQVFNRADYASRVKKAFGKAEIETAKAKGGFADKNVYDFLRNASAMDSLRRFLEEKGILETYGTVKNSYDVKAVMDSIKGLGLPKEEYDDLVSALDGKKTVTDSEWEELGLDTYGIGKRSTYADEFDGQYDDLVSGKGNVKLYDSWGEELAEDVNPMNWSDWNAAYAKDETVNSKYLAQIRSERKLLSEGEEATCAISVTE